MICLYHCAQKELSEFILHKKNRAICQVGHLAIEHDRIIHNDRSLLLVQYKFHRQDSRPVQLYMPCLSKQCMSCGNQHLMLNLPAALDVEIKLYNRNMNRKNLFLLQIIVRECIYNQKEKKKRNKQMSIVFYILLLLWVLL